MPSSPPVVPKLGRHNPRLAGVRRLARGADPTFTVVDGAKLVLDLTERGVEPIEVFTTPEHTAMLLAHRSIRNLAHRGAVFEIEQDAAERIAPTRSSQGVLAVVGVPHSVVQPVGTVVFLDRVQDPGNVGAVVRCAAAFGATGVVCSPGCGNPFSPKSVRASAGLSLLFPVQTESPLSQTSESFRVAGGEVAATVGSGGVAASQWRPQLPLLLVLGNEGVGLEQDALRFANSHVSVAMADGVESLNVAVTAGILLAALRGVVPSPILE